MILYHGSNTKIGSVDLKKGRRGKDFGQGFYLTAVKTDAAATSPFTIMTSYMVPSPMIR